MEKKTFSIISVPLSIIAVGIVMLSLGSDSVSAAVTNPITVELAADVYPGLESSFPRNYVEFDNALYFAADGDGNGHEVWKYEPGIGASQVTTIGQGQGSYPDYLTVFNNALYFSADDGNGPEVWKYESGVGSSQVTNIGQGVGGSNPAWLTVYNGKLYFAANVATGLQGVELWEYDGTNPAVMLSGGLRPEGFEPGELAIYNGALYMQGDDGQGGEIWKYDGASFTKISSINPGAGSYPTWLEVFNGELYFAANEGAGDELWKYDGVDIVKIEVGTPGVPSDPRVLTASSDALYFAANGGENHGHELWVYDGINPPYEVDVIPDLGEGSEPDGLTIFDGDVYFGAWEYAGSPASNLWRYDGINAELVMDTRNEGTWEEGPYEELYVFDRKLYFSADGGPNGFEVWRTVFSAAPFCGDGILDPPGEQCDDGNTTPGDGCDATCQIESTAVCGDGNIDYPDESCDDGNTDPGDGCDELCRIEGDSSDGDGIEDEIDEEPLVYSNSYDDELAGAAVRTYGTITQRGAWDVVIWDEWDDVGPPPSFDPIPYGVWAEVFGDGAGGPDARVVSCDNNVETILNETNEFEYIICGSATVRAERALPTIEVRSPPHGTPGDAIFVILTDGQEVTIDNSIVTASENNTESIEWQYVDENDNVLTSGFLAPGESVDLSDGLVCAARPDGMISWWKGEDNATDALDGNDGELMGRGASYTTGMVGNAFSFDGVDSYVDVPKDPSFNVESVALDAWVKLDSYAEAGANPPRIVGNRGQYMLKVGNAGDENEGKPFLIYYTLCDGRSETGCVNGNDGNQYHLRFVRASTPIPLGVWTHVTGTYDQVTGDAKIYVNGVLDGTKLGSTLPGGPSRLRPRPLGVGAFVIGGGPNNGFLHGSVDEIEIFDRAIDESEIVDIVDAGELGKCYECTPPPNNMVSWWKGDDNATDSMDGNDGTFIGKGALYTTGRVENAFGFDGYNTYVDVPKVPEFNVESVTLDAWVKLDDYAETGMEPPRIVANRGQYALKVGPRGNTNRGKPFLIYYTLCGEREAGCVNGNDGNQYHLRYVRASTRIPLEKWTHVTGTYDQVTGDAKIYVNGVLDGTKLGSELPGGPSRLRPRSIGVSEFVIGGGPDNAFLFGAVDEVELFGRALSDVEIADIYEARGAGKCLCGNGLLEPEEECDDGNTIDGDGCSSICELECTVTANDCDGTDNDCDGEIDEADELVLEQACGEVGTACEGGTQTRECIGGAYTEYSSCSTATSDAGICAACSFDGIPEGDANQDIDCDNLDCPVPSCGETVNNTLCGSDNILPVYSTAQNTCLEEGFACNDPECTSICEGDADGDGFSASCECNDADPNINPNALEICDGIDNDCDGNIDNIPSGQCYCFLGDPPQACGSEIGACMKGTQTCDPVTGTFGACEGQVEPAQEICQCTGAPDCADNDDENCNGKADEDCSQIEKFDAIAALQGLLPTGNSKADKEINKAIEKIEKSLGIHVKNNGELEDKHIVWLDTTHLQCKKGHKVFDHEKKAVKHLTNLLKPKKKHYLSDPEQQAVINNVIVSIIAADQLLAETAIAEADPAREGVDIAKAQSELAKGIAEGKADKKIKHFKSAWKKANGKCESETRLSCISEMTVQFEDEAGDPVNVTKTDAEILHPETTFTYGTQTAAFHTSCSRCIEEGDVDEDGEIVSIVDDGRLAAKCNEGDDD